MRNSHGRHRYYVAAEKAFQGQSPAAPFGHLIASWYNVIVDWHNPPQRLLVIWLTGEVEFETSDGDIRRLPAGSVVLAEDTTGKGHISRHSPEGSGARGPRRSSEVTMMRLDRGKAAKSKCQFSDFQLET